MTTLSFTQHPSSVGETYGQHLRSALSFSFSMISGGLACMVHGVFPFLFTNTGSSKIRSLHERMVLNRTRSTSRADMEQTPTRVSVLTD